MVKKNIQKPKKTKRVGKVTKSKLVAGAKRSVARSRRVLKNKVKSKRVTRSKNRQDSQSKRKLTSRGRKQDKAAIAAKTKKNLSTVQGDKKKPSKAVIIRGLIEEKKESGLIEMSAIQGALEGENLTKAKLKTIERKFSEAGIKILGLDALINSLNKSTSSSEQSSAGRTDDPVRMYLREMGNVELLSRQGEIDIAKKIESGKKIMIDGVCQSPLTFRAVVHWHNALKESRMLLREVIDIDSFTGGENLEKNSYTDNADNTEESEGNSSPEDNQASEKKKDEDDDKEKSNSSEEGDTSRDDYDDDSIGMSLAMIEENLRPKIMSSFEKINGNYGEFFDLQSKYISSYQSGKKVSKNLMDKYVELRGGFKKSLMKIHLNNARFEQLVDQLYGLHRRLTSLEGKLLKMASESKVSRESFVKEYLDFELGRDWLTSIKKKREIVLNVDGFPSLQMKILDLLDLI